ncbi:MAG: superoxide dismutase [FCB group bacterium]|jgi:Fe-Mn family superoxide dismutase|nr:superoxide dismutase [FCB group bacterium]
MPFELPPLPFEMDALEPYISRETLEYHYGKHHQAYVTNLNKLVEGRPEAERSLEDIILSSEGAIFNNAAQIWNHTFYWNCLKKDGGEPTGALADAIKRDFGSFETLKHELAATATAQFGSGWGWLVAQDGKLKITKTSNADLPMRHDQHALLTVDVWEHAYYIDYRNARPKYAETLVENLINWDFVAQNFAEAR